MADDSFDNKNYGTVYVAGETNKEWGFAGDAFKPGEVIRVHSDGKLYVSKASDGHVGGVAASKDGHDNDTDFSVGDWVPYYPKGQKTCVRTYLETESPAVAGYKGDDVVLSSTDGQTEIFVNDITTPIDDNLKVGTLNEYTAGSTSEVKLLEVWLG